METEDLNQSSSWISTIALRNAADLKKSLKRSFHHKSASVTSSPLSKSYKTALDLHPSILSQKSTHQRFNTSCIEDIKSAKISEPDVSEKKYFHTISKLNQEIFILSDLLKQAYMIISNLNERLNDSSAKHVIHLQAIQERHEQKLKKTKNDIENLLESEKKAKTAEIERIKCEHSVDVCKIQEFYEKKMNKQQKLLIEEVEKKESDHKKQFESFKQHVLEVIHSLKIKFR